MRLRVRCALFLSRSSRPIPVSSFENVHPPPPTGLFLFPSRIHLNIDHRQARVWQAPRPRARQAQQPVPYVFVDSSRKSMPQTHGFVLSVTSTLFPASASPKRQSFMRITYSARCSLPTPAQPTPTRTAAPTPRARPPPRRATRSPRPPCRSSASRASCDATPRPLYNHPSLPPSRNPSRISSDHMNLSPYNSYSLCDRTAKRDTATVRAVYCSIAKSRCRVVWEADRPLSACWP